MPGTTTAVPRSAGRRSPPGQYETNWPVLICLLGTFRVLKQGQSVTVRGGGKAEGLLCALALRPSRVLTRDGLLETLWPNTSPAAAGQSLNSLVYSLRKMLGDALRGAPPVICSASSYRLNTEAGVGVDTACFDALSDAGDRHLRQGHAAAAVPYYERAIRLYRGNLCTSTDVHAIVERERLRVAYLTLLARLADHHYAAGDYSACLACALRLLDNEPCREDAHRFVMRSCVRRGERAQALRQYELCRNILRREFGAAPEPATVALFDQIRLDPDTV